MSGAAGRRSAWLVRTAVGRDLSYRTVRARLTLLYGGLFVLSGAALMVIAYLLLTGAGFIFSLQGGASTSPGAPITRAGATLPPFAGTTTHPSAQAFDYWTRVSRCMRDEGIAAFPAPGTHVPTGPGAFAQISDRSGVILLFPVGLNTGSATYARAASTCGLAADGTRQLAQEDGQRARARDQLVLQSGIALAAMSLLSLALGWLVAGRVLQPLEAADAALRQFVANASHELRAPLTRQRALIQVALADPRADAAMLRATHERVLAAEQDLEEIINALLALAGGQAGRERHEDVDIAAIAADAVLAYCPEAEALGVSVDTELSVASARGVPRLLERLASNLIANAIRHNIAGGHVEVRTGVRQQAPFMAVTNSGREIPAGDLERLFRPFERAAPARTGHDGGHGLGLTIARAVAEAHGAELELTPRLEGGLVAEIVFPRPRGGKLVRLPGAWLRRVGPRTTLGD